MSASKREVVVVPCSGIGKSFGSVTREAAYALCEDVRPDKTRLVALSKLVLGEPEARDRVRACPVIAIDGCKAKCAATLVRHHGGTVAREVDVLETFRRHKELKPEGIAELNPEGQELARVLAEELRDSVDQLHAVPGGSHA